MGSAQLSAERGRAPSKLPKSFSTPFSSRCPRHVYEVRFSANDASRLNIMEVSTDDQWPS
jgi:hypothetical protein